MRDYLAKSNFKRSESEVTLKISVSFFAMYDSRGTTGTKFTTHTISNTDTTATPPTTGTTPTKATRTTRTTGTTVTATTPTTPTTPTTAVTCTTATTGKLTTHTIERFHVMSRAFDRNLEMRLCHIGVPVAGVVAVVGVQM